MEACLRSGRRAELRMEDGNWSGVPVPGGERSGRRNGTKDGTPWEGGVRGVPYRTQLEFFDIGVVVGAGWKRGSGLNRTTECAKRTGWTSSRTTGLGLG